MPDRYEWSEIAIVGAVGGIMGGILVLAIRLGATIDNLLNFLGGAVGSGLAIVATLWLERRRRARALRHMLDTMVIVADASLRFESVEDERMLAMILTFQQATETLEASRLGVVMESPIHQYGYQSAIFWIKKNLDDLNEISRSFQNGSLSLLELSSTARAYARRNLGPVEDFLSMKGLPKGPKQTLDFAKAQRENEHLSIAAKQAARTTM